MNTPPPSPAFITPPSTPPHQMHGTPDQPPQIVHGNNHQGHDHGQPPLAPVVLFQPVGSPVWVPPAQGAQGVSIPRKLFD